MNPIKLLKHICFISSVSTSCSLNHSKMDHWRTYTFEEKEFYTDGNLKSLHQWNDTGSENPLADETFTFFSEKGDTLAQRVNFYSLGKTPFHFKADSSSYGIKTQKDNLIYIEKQTGEKSLLRNELLKILPIFNFLIINKNLMKSTLTLTLILLAFSSCLTKNNCEVITDKTACEISEKQYRYFVYALKETYASEDEPQLFNLFLNDLFTAYRKGSGMLAHNTVSFGHDLKKLEAVNALLKVRDTQHYYYFYPEEIFWKRERRTAQDSLSNNKEILTNVKFCH